jgi:hypothetical protein
MGKRLSLRINPGATLIIVCTKTVSLFQVQSEINSKSFDFVIVKTQDATNLKKTKERYLHVRFKYQV